MYKYINLCINNACSVSHLSDFFDVCRHNHKITIGKTNHNIAISIPKLSHVLFNKWIPRIDTVIAMHAHHKYCEISPYFCWKANSMGLSGSFMLNMRSVFFPIITLTLNKHH